ncbi:siderophore-interacting protein [Halomonas sp. PAR7]|uniref:siderophore-interacting protein n=1 Tax=Halomonas sp. PAR7 TaxID=3075514 RepID=UPI0028857348|nr:siderophore-interacting protein [Halomonas sp. PAR7]MDT0499827.1 siderophore-interacting protein [Halomonas sp. PAR7]
MLRRSWLTRNMLRITLGGESLREFPRNQQSAYIKLMFPRGKDERPLMRTYTIRHQRPEEIDVDFAMHAQQGPASAWASSAQPGDRILVAGPGGRKLISQEGDGYLLAGDMTALPALSVNLEELPEDAYGYAVIEVRHESDIQPLRHPENIELHWVISPKPDPRGLTLLEKLQSLPRLPGTPSVWAACEFSSMRAIRHFIRQRYDIPKSQFYVSSYWKIGQTEDGHKQTKQHDIKKNQGVWR